MRPLGPRRAIIRPCFRLSPYPGSDAPRALDSSFARRTKASSYTRGTSSPTAKALPRDALPRLGATKPHRPRRPSPSRKPRHPPLADVPDLLHHLRVRPPRRLQDVEAVVRPLEPVHLPVRPDALQHALHQ